VFGDPPDLETGSVLGLAALVADHAEGLVRVGASPAHPVPHLHVLLHLRHAELLPLLLGLSGNGCLSGDDPPRPGLTLSLREILMLMLLIMWILKI